MMKEYPEQMSEIINMESKKNINDNIPTIAIRQIESPDILDIRFIYDDWEKFFSV